MRSSNKQAVASLLAHQNKATPLFGATQHRAAGGGPKKPAMPSTQTDFDVVFVGK